MTVEILDGAIGTELIARGLTFGAPAWSAIAIAEAPAALSELHQEYARSGATIHTANTFRTQPGALGDGWGETLAEAVRLARDAIPSDHRLLGSLAPVEDCYRPDSSPGEGARADHRRVAEALADAGCDGILCETFAHPTEALVAVEESARTGLPVWLALTAGPFADLLAPEELARIAAAAVERGAERVLVNCVAASRMQPYVERVAALGVPFGAYANAGGKEEAIGWGSGGRGGAAAYAELASGWVRAGATVVGGCCGTSPAHIEVLADRFAR